MKRFIEKEFGFYPDEVERIAGYDNANYLVKTASHKYILKTYLASDELEAILTAENEVLLHLQQRQPDRFPKPIAFADGSLLKTLTLDGVSTSCRMLSFLEGRFLGDLKAKEQPLASLGTFVAEMDVALQDLDLILLKARKWEWDLQYFGLNKKYLEYIENPRDRNLVDYFFLQYEEKVLPVIDGLRTQIIHNDANEWNVLTANNEVSGIIDFGDLAYSQLINEVAITITYACMNKEAVLESAAVVLKSYHEVLPLEEKEIAILYYLIAARLCTSVCNSAYAKVQNPENAYATVSEEAAWRLLYEWVAINPIAAENMFRKAVELPPLKYPSVSEEIKRRQTHLSKILSLSYKQPILMERAAFQYMFDAEGNTFLDAYNNIPHVGHSHPKVVRAGQEQMARLNTNTRYLYEALPSYASRLLSKFPDALNKVFFVNSGSAASDLAMRLAHAHTKHRKVMVMEHGYHGNTQLGIDISDYKFNNPKGQGQKEYILKTPIPDTFKGKYSGDSAGKLYAKDAVQQIEGSKFPIAAFITEPVVGCGGQIPLASGYLKDVYAAIRKQGGICISDEVQTGFGRLGAHFWGYEAQDVIPDMVILGKPMANGHPMGAVVTTAEIAASFETGVEFFSSFGGNPVSCAIALSVLDVIEEEQLQQNAKEVGDYYTSLFKNLQQKYECIGDVRGSGLFIGVEITKPRSVEPDTELAQLIKNQLREKHILISTDGPADNVLKSKPPICFTKENAEKVVATVAEILDAHLKAMK